MSISSEKSVFESLTGLGNNAVEIARKILDENITQPDKVIYLKWKLNDFEYTDTGVKNSGATGEHITKNDWSTARMIILAKIQKLEQYKKLETKLDTTYPSHPRNLFDFFANNLIPKCFPKPLTKSEVEHLTELFIKYLKDEPIKRIAEAELTGLVIRSNSIRISDEFTIRQTQKSDLEKEVLERDEHRYGHLPYPSVIMKVESFSKANDLGKKIQFATDVFRLFKVGSIKFLKYSMPFESFGPGLGWVISHDRSNPLDFALIKESEEEQLRKFWKIMEHNFPESFSVRRSLELSFREIAYERYSDALLKNGTVEHRIANAMMGLESVFLRGGELQELSYRLRMRVAKLVGFFGYDPHEATRVIRDAYEVRSKYVHGGLLNFEKKDKFNENYGDIKNLLLLLLNYLRISIVVSIMMITSKDEFVSTIDKSFLETKSNERLVQIIDSSRRLFDLI